MLCVKNQKQQNRFLRVELVIEVPVFYIKIWCCAQMKKSQKKKKMLEISELKLSIYFIIL